MIRTLTFKIDPVETPGLVHVNGLSLDSAKETEKLLEENNSRFHIFFTSENDKGVYLHNHNVHHALTLWALGAKPQVIRKHQDRNAQYQRPSMVTQSWLIEDMADPAIFQRCRGREENFKNFERFFLKQIHERGYQYVLQKYLLDGTEIANDMLCRMFMGYVHGLIHIGLGLEFKQPLILAEGLAQSAVHNDLWYIEYLALCESQAARADEPALPLSALIDMCRLDHQIRNSSSIDYHRQTRPHSGRWAMDKEMARDGVLKSAKAELVRLAARFRVSPPGLDQAVAELMNTAVYLTAGAQRPPHECAFDFFLLHTITSSICAVVFANESSLAMAQKCRLVEYIGRCCMMTFAGMGCPEPNLDWLLSHPSKLPDQTWETVFQRACHHEDDGHMIKMIRCMRLAQLQSQGYEHLPEFKIKDDMFLPAAIAAIDSGSTRPMEWTKHFDFIRGAGYPGAWDSVPLRPARLQHNGEDGLDIGSGAQDAVKPVKSLL